MPRPHATDERSTGNSTLEKESRGVLVGRNDHFEDGHGDITVGYDIEDGAICKGCASDDPEYATVDPRSTVKIKLSDIGDPSSAYPSGFTCAGCGNTVGAWRD